MENNNLEVDQSPIDQPGVSNLKPKINCRMSPRIVPIILLAITGIFLFSLINSQNSKNDAKTAKTDLISPTQSSGKTEQFIKWVNYTNPQYDFLKFKYPEGSTLSFKEDKENQIEGCFTLILQYEEMTIDITRLCGIGGRSALYNSPYTIVAGNNYEGVGKVIQEDLSTNKKRIHYFGYSNGAQQFGGFLIDTAGFTFEMPFSAQARYEPIADIMATSVLNKLPNKQEVPAKMYRQEEAIMGVNSDKTEYTILKADSAQKERVETASINPTGEYLAITTFIGQGPDSYLYLYDLNSKKLLAFNDQTRFSTIGDPEIWVSNFVVVDADLKGYYKYDVKNLTKISITREEYVNFSTAK